MQAVRLAPFISMSCYLPVFGQLGGMCSSFGIRNRDFFHVAACRSISMTLAILLGAILASRGAILRRSRVLFLYPCLSALGVVVFRYLGKPRYIVFSSLVSVSRYPHISVTLYPGISVSRYLLISISLFSITSAILEICFRAFRSRYRGFSTTSAILEICVQALRLAPFISISWYLHVFGQLGGMFSSFESCHLEPSWDYLGPFWGHLGHTWGHLGAILGRSWAHLGAILGQS